MAAVAWYQDKIPNKPAKLEDFLKDVEHFAMTDYLTALNAGNKLDSATKRQIAEKLQGYTSVPADYWYKANLRVAGGQFEHELLRDSGELTGRNDGRFAAYALDPLGEFAEYDPQSQAIGSTYVSLLNEYLRGTLKFGTANEPYLPRNGSVNQAWDFKHVFPGAGFSPPTGLNVLPDLATAMIQNPDMKVMLNSGYYDLTTAYYAAEFQLQHLAIPDKLQANITYARYPSGHMVYANEASAKALHDNVAKFISDSHK
jgi:carboxypeptidase C (cathepsin A)